MNSQIICVQFPALIHIELKDKYTNWYKRCCFISNLKEIPISASLVILPAYELKSLKLKDTSVKCIAFGSPEDLERSYLLGCDDYLKEPWNISELLIRSSKYLNPKNFRIENYDIKMTGTDFYINNKDLKLTPIQNKILNLFFENPGVYFNYKDLQERLSPALLSSEASLYVHIHNIRKILKEELSGIYDQSIYLKNSNRSGYALFLPVDNLCKNVDKPN